MRVTIRDARIYILAFRFTLSFECSRSTEHLADIVVRFSLREQRAAHSRVSARHARVTVWHSARLERGARERKRGVGVREAQLRTHAFDGFDGESVETVARVTRAAE